MENQRPLGGIFCDGQQAGTSPREKVGLIFGRLGVADLAAVDGALLLFFGLVP